MRRLWRFLAIAAGCLLLALCLLIWNFDQPPSAYSRIHSVPPRSSQADVISQLGEPDSIQADGRTLAYSRPLAWDILYVHFDEQQRMTHFYYDR